MKKKFIVHCSLFIVHLIVLGLSVTGCLETTREIPITLTVSTSAIHFPFSGEEQTITIDSNTNAWKLTCDASWVTITPSSGAKKGTVTVRASSNSTTENLSATITITAMGILSPQTIPVSIGAAPSLTVTPSTLSFNATDTPKLLTVASNTNWTVSNSAAWLNVAPMSGTNNGTLTVTAVSNASVEQRTATVSVSNPDLSQPRNVNVTQSGVTPVLQVSPTSLSFAANDLPKTFNVTSNISWSVSNSASWLTIDPLTGSGDSIVTVSASANTNTAERNVNLTVSGSGVTSRTVGVSQSGNAPPSLSVSPSSLSFTTNDSPKNFTITSNISWSVNFSGASWLKVAPMTGSGDGTVTLTAAANTNATGRNVNLTVSGTGVTSQTVSVLQSGTDPSINIDMVLVPGGTFIMGCTSEQGNVDCYDNEKPQHSVTLSTFYIGKYEVTQGQWKAYMGVNPSSFKNGDNYPVEHVSWDDIVGTNGASTVIYGIRYYENGFIYKLNQKTGMQYRLPTEAEWEYAARGGQSSRKYKYSGSNAVGNVAWYSINSGSSTHPVGTRAANELEIYDMSGNVREWCSDWYSAGYYSNSPQDNPTGPSFPTSPTSSHVYRGGSWNDNAVSARVSFRPLWSPIGWDGYFGFRLARSLN